MSVCNNFCRLFRLFFSLRGGLSGLCFVYIIYMLSSLVANSQPLLLITYSSLLSQNLLSIGTAYHTFGIFVTVLAVAGLLFNEKKFILPLLVFESILFVAYIFTFGYLLQTKNPFLEQDKHFVKYIGQIGLGYFAMLLEYNFYRDLIRKTRARPQGIPESLIILPSNAYGPINPRAVLQQYKTDRSRSASVAENDSYHYVYGVSESMIRFLRAAPHSSRSSSHSTLLSAVLYNAESESILEAPSPPPSFSGVFYSAQAEGIPRAPPPPYKP